MDETQRHIYYKTTTKLVLPENSNWRYWKYNLPDGRWKIFKGINSIQQLRDLLVMFNPIAFYYSTSLFLPQQMPDKIENPDYQIADQLFLDNPRLVVDIDNKLGPEQVKKSAWEVINKMREFKESYRFESCLLTGTGLRLEFADLTKRPELLPPEKERWIKRRRQEFCQVNLSDIPCVDDIVAWDTRRIIKGIGSPNKYNEYTTQVIASPAYFPAIPGKAVSKVNETLEGFIAPPPLREPGKSTDRELGSSPSYPLVFGKFIRNKIEGTKDRFVPYFVYSKKFKHWKDDLIFLQKQYGLSSIFIMDDTFKVLCIGIDAIPEQRLDKIYRHGQTLLKKTWFKFHNLYIRTSCFYNQDLQKIKEYDLKPFFRIDNSAHKIYPVSKPHLDFLNFVGFDTKALLQEDRQIIGNDKNRVYESFYEKRKENGQR
jgi:hypothetical protein